MKVNALAVVVLFLLFAARKGATMATSTLPPSSRRMTIDQLRYLAKLTGFPDPDTAAAVAMAESGGDPSATNDTRGRTDLPPHTQPEYSLGLWQINVLAHPQFAPDRLSEAGYNAYAALAVSSGGTNFSPWSTFNDGSYKQHMPAAAVQGDALSPAQIQTALNNAGVRPLLLVDGIIGEHTRSSVRLFQASQGLVVDGIPGPKTQAALRPFLNVG